MAFQLEICAFNLRSALIAQKAGADRIEFCADPAAGGTTPSYANIMAARTHLSIPLYPIIRPRTGDFLYTKEEYEIMLEDILQCRKLGCDGVVVGMLRADGSIDKERCSKIVELAYPMGVTFHRAFDWCSNPFEALEDIIEIGCERILTSGQQPTAAQGASFINDLVRQSENRILIMPGSGVRAANIRELAEKTGAVEFHSSARTQVQGQMEFVQPAMQDDLSLPLCNEKEIESMRQLLESFFKMTASAE